MSMIRADWVYRQEDAAFYEEHGYCIFDQFLTEKTLTDCQQRSDEMQAALQPGRDPADIISAHEFHSWIWDLATETKILDLIESQIGPNIVFWSSHLVSKPPHSGIEIPWHQDSPYWNVGGPLPSGLWIAFDDMREENGAMCVLPGWQTKGTLPIDMRDEALFNQMVDPTALPAEVANMKVQYSMPAGGMAIHNTMIPHNSLPNHSDYWRRVLVLRYMTADAEMGKKTYEDYRDGTSFPRKYYLVRGEDVGHRNLPRIPALLA